MQCLFKYFNISSFSYFNYRFFSSISFSINGYYAFIDKFNDHPFQIHSSKLIQNPILDTNNNIINNEDNFINTIISNTKEIEINYKKNIITFPISSINYLFINSNKQHINIKELNIFLDNFNIFINEYKDQIYQYFINEENQGIPFTIDDIIDLFKTWKLDYKFNMLNIPLDISSRRLLLQYGFYNWITKLKGKEYFIYLPPNQPFYGKKVLLTYPFYFSCKINNKKEKIQRKISLIDTLQERNISIEIRNQINNIIQGKLIDKLNRININEDVYVIDSKNNVWCEDAISLGEKHGNKQWINIHIIDISHYIPYNSPLDNYSKILPSNIYLQNKTYFMIPNELDNYLSFHNSNECKTLTFSVLYNKTNNNIEKYKIQATNIKKENIKILSFHQANIHLQSGDIPDLTLLYKYSKLLKNLRNNYIKDIDNYCIDSKNKANIIVQSPSILLIRNMMLLCGFIAGNIANNKNISMIYRNRLGPYYDNIIDNNNKSLQSIIYNKKSMIQINNTLDFKIYSPVSSPIRKYSNLLNHYQIYKLLLDDKIISNNEISLIINNHNRILSEINNLQSLDYKKTELISIQKNIGIGGKIQGEILKIYKGISSGRKSLIIDIRIINYPKIIVTEKIITSNKLKEGESYNFIIQTINPDNNKLSLILDEKIINNE